MFFIFLLFTCIVCENINCNKTNNLCNNTHINCIDNTCDILCNNNSCINTIIHCSNLCTINCNEQNSCENIKIYYIENNKPNIFCKYHNSCQKITQFMIVNDNNNINDNTFLFGLNKNVLPYMLGVMIMCVCCISCILIFMCVIVIRVKHKHKSKLKNNIDLNIQDSISIRISPELNSRLSRIFSQSKSSVSRKQSPTPKPVILPISDIVEPQIITKPQIIAKPIIDMNIIFDKIIPYLNEYERWDNRIVNKQWYNLIYDKYWIYNPNMSENEINLLKINDNLEFRDLTGKYLSATIVDQLNNKYKIHYNGWSNKWDIWCDFKNEFYRFAKKNYFKKRKNIRCQNIFIGMKIDINPKIRHCGWTQGKIRQIDNNTGQIQVIYKYENKKYMIWSHLDNKNEIEKFGVKTMKL